MKIEKITDEAVRLYEGGLSLEAVAKELELIRAEYEG